MAVTGRVRLGQLLVDCQPCRCSLRDSCILDEVNSRPQPQGNGKNINEIRSLPEGWQVLFEEVPLAALAIKLEELHILQRNAKTSKKLRKRKSQGLSDATKIVQ